MALAWGILSRVFSKGFSRFLKMLEFLNGWEAECLGV